MLAILLFSSVTEGGKDFIEDSWSSKMANVEKMQVLRKDREVVDLSKLNELENCWPKCLLLT